MFSRVFKYYTNILILISLIFDNIINYLIALYTYSDYLQYDNEYFNIYNIIIFLRKQCFDIKVEILQ